MNRPTLRRIFFAGLALACSLFAIVLRSNASDSITLPLQGYYHPGRYMPVTVAVTPKTSDESTVGVFSPGAVGTYIRCAGERIEVTVPWMPMDERARRAFCSIPGQRDELQAEPALKPLGEHERLIAYAGVSPEAAKAMATILYPRDTAILVPLNPAQPMPGVAAAWTTLDAAIFDATTAKHLDESRFSTLISHGVAVAVDTAADRSPIFPHWPWKQSGDWRYLRYEPAGPKSAAYLEAVQTPAAGLKTGWPVDVRRGLWITAAVFSILLLLLALWHPRFTVILAVLLAGAFVGGLTAWAHLRKPLIIVGGKIRIISSGMTQDDDWAYISCHQGIQASMRWIDTTTLMFASPIQLDESRARIVCYPNGDPDFIYVELHPKSKIAMLCRRGGPRAPETSGQSAVTSPLQDLVRDLYLQPGDEVIGEFPSTPLMASGYTPITQWPAVLIHRSNPKAQ
jgi:hypothetical protein